MSDHYLFSWAIVSFYFFCDLFSDIFKVIKVTMFPGCLFMFYFVSFQICHHPGCTRNNENRPMLLCKECDNNIHQRADYSGHLVLDLPKRKTRKLTIYCFGSHLFLVLICDTIYAEDFICIKN